MTDSERTTIQVQTDVRDRLADRKVVDRESYNSVLERLLEATDGSENDE